MKSILGGYYYKRDTFNLFFPLCVAPEHWAYYRELSKYSVPILVK